MPLQNYISLLTLALLACNKTPQTLEGHKYWTYDWSNIRPEMKDSIEYFARSNAISGEAFGPAGRTPK